MFKSNLNFLGNIFKALLLLSYFACALNEKETEFLLKIEAAKTIKLTQIPNFISN